MVQRFTLIEFDSQYGFLNLTIMQKFNNKCLSFKMNVRTTKKGGLISKIQIKMNARFEEGKKSQTIVIEDRDFLIYFCQLTEKSTLKELTKKLQKTLVIDEVLVKGFKNCPMPCATIHNGNIFIDWSQTQIIVPKFFLQIIKLLVS